MPSRRFNRLQRAIHAFSTGSEGVVAIEFAMIGLPFVLLLVGILVVALMCYCTAVLDYATQRSSRQIMVGQTQNNNLTLAQFKSTILCPMLPPGLFDCSKISVNLANFATAPQIYNSNLYYQFVKTDRSGLIVPASPNFCPGAANSYQVLQIIYPFPVLLSLFSSSSQVVNGQFVMMSSITFKNEPYAGGSSTTYSGC